MRFRFKHILALVVMLWVGVATVNAQLLEVKAGKTAIVKTGPSGESEELTRLPAGTVVTKVDDAPRYYHIKYDGGLGWSYKGNWEDKDGTGEVLPVTKETLLARSDVLKIIVIDVEVGDATLIICPQDENGNQDLLLIDTGEPKDFERVKAVLLEYGFSIWDRPITRFYTSHFDRDHVGDVDAAFPLTKVVYDHGNNGMTTLYKNALKDPGLIRRLMTLNYEEEFTGGVKVECVASNFQTDFDASTDTYLPHKDKNENSVALIISYGDFEYFTAGDLTKNPEKRLATGITDVDVYHVNHHGSNATSSRIEFVTKLSPEVSIASNGTQHGHPTETVANRLISVDSKFYQTNYNDDKRAHRPDLKYIADDSNMTAGKNAEQPDGNIIVVVDTVVGDYYVVMPDLLLNEATFPIEVPAP